MSNLEASAATNQEVEWIIEHRRTARNQGVRILAFGALLVAAFTSFAFMIDDDPWFLAVWSTFTVLSGCATLYFGVLNLRHRGIFVCRISAEQIECVAPVRHCGESFVILLSELAAIEEEVPLEGAASVYLRHREGRRHLLTQGYGVPVDRFIELIMRLNPSVSLTRINT